MDRADSDLRAFLALLVRLESHPEPAIRQQAAWYLLRRVH